MLKKGRTGNRKRKVPKWLIVIIILSLIVAATVAACSILGGSESDKAQAQTYTVERGSVTKAIEASGTIEPNDEYSVTSMLKGDIIADYIEEGMQVKEGDVLYEIDPESVNKSILTAKENIQKAADNLESANKTLRDLSITASFSGVVTELSVKNGDEVNAGTPIATVKDTENLVLTVPFNVGEAERLSVGQSAKITLASSNSEILGSVKSVSGGSIVNSEGVPVKNVEISVKNPGAITDGEMATAMVSDIACNSYGTFSYGSEKTYTATAKGTVTNLNFVEGDKVSGGAMIAYISSTDVNSSVNNARIAYNQAVRQLDDLNDSLEDDYKIKAKVTGKIVQKNSKKGDTLDATNGATVMAIIQDVDSLKFNMTVDELDITYMKAGQKVEVTADAVEGVKYEGVIKTVSTVGTSANGVTTYPVEVTLAGEDIERSEKAVYGSEDYERKLIPGMNVDANVIVDTREDVLCIPVSAVQKGNLVVAKVSGASEEKNGETEENKPRIADAIEIPEGFSAVTVETGLSDDKMVEIKSGLSEGDVVVVPEVQVDTMMNGVMGMMGMPAGGAPGGGAPEGAQGGGNRPSGGGNRQ